MKYYEDWKKANSKRIMSKILDPDGLLTGNGYGLEGVYEFEFVNIADNTSISAYIGQAGNIRNAPAHVASDIYERILQHIKRMLGNPKYYEYWTGLDDADPNWKIKVHLLQAENDHAKRLQLEENYICARKPFLQDTVDNRFDLYPTKYGYSRNDLCIHPWTRKGDTAGQRRLAFLHRVKSLENV